jgi:hypothetical protein
MTNNNDEPVGVGPEYERNVPHTSGQVGHRRESVS